MDADANRKGGVGKLDMDTGTGKRGSKIGKVLQTTFMDGPLHD